MADDKATVHNPIELQRYLDGVDYPVSKRDLVSHARDHGAPDDVTTVLDRLPGDEFDSPADVSKAVGALNRR